MARRAPFGSFHEDPPAIVRESMPLFEYVMEQTKAAKEVSARLDAAREDHARTVTILHESMEWRELEAAKERMKDARKAALENDDDLANAREEAKAAAKALKKTAAALVKAEKKARGEVKLLAAVKGETERRVLGALAAGKVPQVTEERRAS